MPFHTAYISSWLKEFESRQLTAYVPCADRNYTGRNDRASCGPVIGASGVTIGIGLDLGQQSEADLERMGVSADLRTLFRPYLGRRKEAACSSLRLAPFSLTDAQCDALDAAVHADYIRRAAALYDRHAEKPFEDIPAQAQTVLVSLFYHLGSPFPSAGHSGYPKLWGHLIRGDWAAAAGELQHGFTRFASRRAREGKLLEELI